jgi:hypothetical protein
MSIMIRCNQLFYMTGFVFNRRAIGGRVVQFKGFYSKTVLLSHSRQTLFSETNIKCLMGTVAILYDSAAIMLSLWIMLYINS